MSDRYDRRLIGYVRDIVNMLSPDADTTFVVRDAAADAIRALTELARVVALARRSDEDAKRPKLRIVARSKKWRNQA